MNDWELLDPVSRDQPQTRRERRAAMQERRSRRRRIWLAVIPLLIVAAVLVSTGLAYSKLDSNIERIDLTTALGTERPTAEAEGPLNILVMGSDTRQGLGTREYGVDTAEGGAQSDTNMLVHLSADRKRALVVSIPRDSMVPSPRNCAVLTSRYQDEVIRQWNKNYNQGGPSCVIRTLERNTRVLVDHFVVIDFMGFRRMVDALGGVEVCLPEPVSDRDARIELEAGRQVLSGEEALGYVRMRKSLGDGSDLGRIERQQTFLSSVAQKATSTSLLLRPDRLYSFLDAATESMTTDSELGTAQMARIANSVRSIGLDKVEFVTVPTEEYPEDPNRVQWTAGADDLWEAIRQDRPLNEEPDETPTAPATTSAPATPAEPLTVSPDEISVIIQNAAGVGGLAGQATRALAVQGFVAMTGSGVASDEVSGTVIRFSADKAEAARTVQAAFPNSELVEDEEAGELIVVQMGKGAINPVEVPNRLGFEPLPEMTVSAEHLVPGEPEGGETPTPEITVRSADQDICG